MASNSGQEAKFSLVLDDQVSSAATSAGDSLDSLRERIASGESAVKNMRASFNRLRGSTDEVKAAKEELTAKLNAERAAISSANLQLLKAGVTYDSVAVKAKKLAQEEALLAKSMSTEKAKLAQEEALLAKSMSTEKAKAMSAALSAAGGPVGGLVGKMNALKEVAGGAGGRMGAMTFAVAGLIGASVALTAALVGAVYSLGKFLVTTVDAERSANLLRQAWSGTAENAGNLGTQVDALAEKVPTSTAELNQLAISLMKSKLGGQATVDAFNAVGQASAALGEEAAGKIKDFIERGRLMGRMRIDPHEMLEGFGNLNFDHVAKALAKNTHKTVDAARLELMQGRTKLGDGAKAMSDAVEQNFGDINLKKMTSLSGLSETLKKNFAGLTRGVNMEPILQGLGRLVALFNTSTTSGAALKAAISVFADVMGSALKTAMPFVEVFMKGMIHGALDVVIAILRLRNWIRDTFSNSSLFKGIDGMNLALMAGKYAIGLMVGSVVLLGGALALVLTPVAAAAAAISKLVDVGESIGPKIRNAFKSLDWGSVGRAIPEGILSGLSSGASGLLSGVSSLAEDAKSRFKKALGIASPSKIFAGYGENTAEGYAQGVDRAAPEAARAVDSMVATPSPSGGSGGGGTTAAAASNSIVVNFVYQAGPGVGGDVASQVDEPSVRASIVKILQEAALGRGVPVSP